MTWPARRPGAFGEGILDIAVEMRRPCPILGTALTALRSTGAQQAQRGVSDGAAACGPKAIIAGSARGHFAFAHWA